MSTPPASGAGDPWEAAAERTGGVVVRDAGGKPLELLIRHGPWTIRVEESFNAATKGVDTSARAAFAGSDWFRCSIRRKTVMADLLVWLGMQDVQVGHPEFDSEFVVKGNDDAEIRQLFADGRLRALLLAHPGGRLQVTDPEQSMHAAPEDATHGLGEVVYERPGRAPDAADLHAMAAVVGETLDQLLRMGAIAECPVWPAACRGCGQALMHQAACPECGRPAVAPGR